MGSRTSLSRVSGVGASVMAVTLVLILSACASSGAWMVLAPSSKGSRPAGPMVTKVSCSTPTFCVATGPGPAASASPAMAWDGATWRTVGSPGFDTYLLRCFPDSRCLALGYDQKAIWNGTSWARSAGGATVDVCPAIQDCYQLGRNDVGQQLRHWDGTTLSDVSVPPASTRSLTGIECPAVGTCVFTTSWEFSDGPHVMERWDHGTWTVETIDDYIEPSAISCASTTACVVVGRAGGGANGYEPAVAVRQGTTWHVVHVPAPSATTTFDSVDCATATSCVAHGDNQFAAVFNGTTWRAVPMPTPSPGISDVECVTATQCFVVVGDQYLASDSTSEPYIEQWDGQGWRPAAIIGDPVVVAGFDGVSCATATDCLAVGTYRDGALSKVLAEWWDGTQWTVVPDVPLPAGAAIDRAHPLVVDCGGPQSCMAAGTVSVGGVATPLAAHWNGSAWQSTSLAPVASPAGPVVIVDVACASASACLVVGDQSDPNANQATWFAQRWDGTSWSSTTAPGTSARNRGFVRLDPELSCPSVSFCGFENSWTSPAATYGTTVQFYNGTSWATAPSPLPAIGSSNDGLSGTLLSLDCTGASFCVGTGFRMGGSVIVEWNGTTWTEKSPFLAFVLPTVSCASAGHCLAMDTTALVGGATLGGYALDGEGEAWGSTVTPADPRARQATGVSCVPANDSGATVCIVVGRSTAGGASTPFADRFQLA
jgi:hypothetical protein